MQEDQAPGAGRLALLRPLWGIVARPRETLERLHESGGRSWWVPMVVAFVFVVLPILAAAPITAEQAREVAIATQEEMGERWDEMELSAEQEAEIERMMGIVASPLITVVFPVIATLILRVVGWLAWAGALYLAAMTIGGQSTYGQMFRVVVWAWVPYAIRGLLQTLYILGTGQVIANPGLSGLVARGSSTADVLTASSSMGETLLVSLLSSVDLFMFWNLALLAVGVVVTTRLSRRKAILVTLAVWLVLTAVVMIPSAISVLFAQQISGSSF
jgi:hypothetical protein